MAQTKEELVAEVNSARNTFNGVKRKIDISLGDDTSPWNDLLEEQHELKRAFDNFVNRTGEYIEALDATADKDAIVDLNQATEQATQLFTATRREVSETLWRRYATPEVESKVKTFESNLERVKGIAVQPASRQDREIEGDTLNYALSAFARVKDKWSRYVPHRTNIELSDKYDGFKNQMDTVMARWAVVGASGGSSVYDEPSGQIDVLSTTTNFAGPVQGDVGQPPDAAVGGQTTPPQPLTATTALQPDGPGTAPFHPQTSSTPLPTPLPLPRSVRINPPDQASPQRVDASRISLGISSSALGATPKLKFAPLSLPTFNGDRKRYWSWKKSWLTLQALAEPTGQEDCKLFQLLSCIDERIKTDLSLNHCRIADEVFRNLEARFGDKKTTALQIMYDLESFPAVRGDRPRDTIKLIQAVERALCDLQDLDMEDTIKNNVVTETIEKKLPIAIREKWLNYEREHAVEINPRNYFDRLLSFLRGHVDILERLAGIDLSSNYADKKSSHQGDRGSHRDRPGRRERPNQRDRPGEKRSERSSFTKSTGSEVRKESQRSPCAMCGDGMHGKRPFHCQTFKKASLSERRAHVRKIGACVKCLTPHSPNDVCIARYLCKNRGCTSPDHHYLLCPKADSRKEANHDRVPPRNRRGPTEEQEAMMTGLGLNQEQKEKLWETFTNKATSNVCSKSPEELPVLMMLLKVETKGGQELGALIDLASDTNYITHRAAKELGITGDDITLVVHGVGKMEAKIHTKRYRLTVKKLISPRRLVFHEMICYGLDDIAQVECVVEPGRLGRFFPNVKREDLERPRSIELLISAREGSLAPNSMERNGDLVLWDGPLGKTVSGVHPDLFEKVEVTTRNSMTHFACSMRTVAVKVEEYITGHIAERIPKCVTNAALSQKEEIERHTWDSIGAACIPACGGCRCGNCPPGGKEMSLSDERELAIIKAGLTFKEKDAHSDQPHWDARYPWKEPLASLPNNRKAVEATFLRTEKRLMKDPGWKQAYTRQIHEMVERGAAIKLTRPIMEKWRGAIWYISHLAAPNPHSVSTPVRIVWNSSQEFEGVSLNSILLKGPDVLNQIRAVLLRFREGVFAAIGDIKKMYNSVWLEEEEVHVHRFLWRDSPQDEISEMAITRVNMGDKPSGCIAQVAMRETANLPQFSHLVDERSVIQDNSYVDDLLTSGNDPRRLEQILEGVETILRTGGFYLKPWIRSGQSSQSGRNETEATPETLVLPNQLQGEDSKALGVGYLVKEDRFFAMSSVNFSTRRQKMRMGEDLSEEEIMHATPNPLTRRVLLSQVAGLYDPIGLVTPLKQKGAILVRRAFQEAGKLTRDTWDEPLSNELRDRAIELFQEYARLSKVTFPRSITPAGWLGQPIGITFSDGSCDSYGAVLYFRWETSEGVVTRLVESKAKLTPLDQRGDPIKAEICGAVFATRLKGYVLKHGRIQVKQWYHLVDSQTVLGAIQRESYGFQTFFANRVGEIQKAGPTEDWRWIPGSLNIADLVTRGHCTPELLSEDSTWQRGPDFLEDPTEKWPMKSASEVASAAREVVSKLQRKAFTTVTRAQAKMSPPPVSTASSDEEKTKVVRDDPQAPASAPGSPTAEDKAPRKLWGAALVSQVNPRRFESLTKLCNVIGYVRRALEFWLWKKKKPRTLAKWEALTVKERQVAFKELCLTAQNGMEFPTTTLNRLVVRKDEETGLLLCRGRVQTMSEEDPGVPLLPYKEWISTLLAQEAHRANHEGVAGTLLRIRNKAWIIQGPRVARNVIDSCVHCRKRRAKMCRQVMSDLPKERTTPAAPFEFTTLDLFGPYTIRDGVRRRTSKKAWGVVFSCMASRAVHADIVEDLSTEGFLKTYQRFTALRGHPRKLWSDHGTNFIGAKPILKELYEFLASIDKGKVQKKTAESGTDWTWVFHPADSPHRNGAAEAAVGILKRALSSVGGEENMTALEFQTLLFLSANLSNERPIGAKTQLQDGSIEVITPNSLLLGRTGPHGDPGGFEFTGYPLVRLRAIQDEVKKFWKRWSQLAGPGLFVRDKWHTMARNVAVGDVVWLADQNTLRGQFRLGRVVEVHPDSKGVVRDVKVKTCHSIPASTSRSRSDQQAATCPTTILHRDVRRLVVLLPVEEQ